MGDTAKLLSHSFSPLQGFFYMSLCVIQVREVYERSIANVPPAPEKRYWQRYIYLWIRYALWEELEAEDAERTRAVYRACLNLIPHSIFTFAKVSTPASC